MPKLSVLLSSLVEEFPDLDLSGTTGIEDAEVRLLTSDSRKVSQENAHETIYVAVKGATADGHSFLADVAAKGALLRIGEGAEDADSGETKTRLSSAYLRVPDSRAVLGLLASAMEGHPSREMLVLGITGTSGKTTVSYLMESALREAGKKVGLIGTVSFRIDGKEIPSTHTTPGPVELQRLLRRMRDEGCDTLVMEVSSHALNQHRAIGVAFDGGIFTNLTEEHLDYHADMNDYFMAKRVFFDAQAVRSKRWGKEPVFAIHSGSPYGERLLREVGSGAQNAAGFALPSPCRIDAEGIQGDFSGVPIQSKLIGRFNAENIAAAVALLKALPSKFGVEDSAIQRGIDSLERVPGRLERVEDPKGGRIILVDYAHKPDALEKVLEMLRPMRKGVGKLICVFGCGGDRDRAKRPTMGAIACRLSDQVIITSDNPRTESPEAIIDAIETGCHGYKNWVRITDRAKAIQTAILGSKAGDIILIAGKGHEDYQIIGTEKLHFDDREVATNFLD
jgi:UDP-N-acetylmuramoyl-L-alanyl-D-glutamate--2,6-diaminopimelate ligase